MAFQTAYNDTVEPFHDVDAEALAGTQLYGVMSGCALTYDGANMTVDIAAGVVMHNGLPVTVAAQVNAVTLVSDGSNPRWSWIGVNSSGTGVLISGTAAVTPAKPEYSTDIVPLGLVRVPAGETVASDIPSADRLDKRSVSRYLGHEGSSAIASASTLVAPSGGGDFHHISGTTTITALMAGYGAGNEVCLVFDDILTLTHNGTSLIIPGAANITTAAGDVAICRNEGSDNWRVVNYVVAANTPGGPGLNFAGSQTTEATISSTTAQDMITISSLSIPATTPFIICGNARKTGTTDSSGIGLKLNATEVSIPVLSGSTLGLWSSATAAVDGSFFAYIGPRVTNYVRTGARMAGGGPGTQVSGDNSWDVATADLPAVTITSVIITGDMSGSTDTLGVDEVFVYTLATS